MVLPRSAKRPLRFSRNGGRRTRPHRNQEVLSEFRHRLAAEKRLVERTGVAMVVRERETEKDISVEKSCYIASLVANSSLAARHIRGRWGVENGLHWRLDVGFREDHRRVRKGNGPENFAILCHIALNLLKKEKSLKAGIQTKRLKAAWNEACLLKVPGV
ncbi:MAG: ISAs1 family transposase [Desulfococcaceae bacterium]